MLAFQLHIQQRLLQACCKLQFPFSLTSIGFSQFLVPPFSSVALCQASLLRHIKEKCQGVPVGPAAGIGCCILCCLCVSAAHRGTWSVPVQQKVNEVGAHGGQVELRLPLLWK